MLQYEKIDFSEEIDASKTSLSKECMLCHYWYFKDIWFKFEPNVCNKCRNILMTFYELKNTAILNVKGVNFTCILRSISRDEADNRIIGWIILCYKVKVFYKWILVQIKHLLKFITYFGDIYSGVTGKWCKKSWKVFDQKFYFWDYYDVSVNKYGVKCGSSLRFWEDKGWINEIDPHGWSQWYFRYWLGGRSQDDQRQINRWKGIVSRFKGKLVKMVKDTGSKYDDYSISPKLRQIFLYWGYELTGKDFFIGLTK